MHNASREALSVARTRLAELRERTDRDGLGRVAEGLLSVVRLLDQEGHLRRTLGDASLPAATKSQLLDGLLSGQLDSQALEVVKGVAGERWSSARDLVDAIEVLAVSALFDTADEDGALDEVEDELFRFSRIVAQEPDLRAALTERGVDTSRKQTLLSSLLEGKVKPQTLRVAEALVVTPRGRTLEDGLAEYARLAAEVRSRTLATVTSAVPLDETQQQRLAAALSTQLGRQVQLQVEVDPSMLGGVRVRIGDEVIDGSTRTRLADARRSFS